VKIDFFFFLKLGVNFVLRKYVSKYFAVSGCG